MAEKKTGEKKDMTFETALSRLEEIVKNMESGSIPLDAALSLFEEGVNLVKFCNKALDTAEKKVKILQKGEDGELAEVDFTSENKE